MNTQLRAYEDPEPRVPALPQYNSMPTLSPPHTPVSPSYDEELSNLLSDSIMDFIDQYDPISDSIMDFIDEFNVPTDIVPHFTADYFNDMIDDE